MSKSSKKIQKNIKQNKEKKQKEYPVKNQIMNLAKVIVAIIITSFLISVIASIANKEYTLEESKNTIENEILAGQTFNRNNETYYVAFYEFGSEEDLESTITNLENTKIYKVDLKNKMNSQIINGKSNKNATKSEELQIVGTTLIKITNNKITDYIEGYDNITAYLKNLD